MGIRFLETSAKVTVNVQDTDLAMARDLNIPRMASVVSRTAGPTTDITLQHALAHAYSLTRTHTHTQNVLLSRTAC